MGNFSFGRPKIFTAWGKMPSRARGHVQREPQKTRPMPYKISTLLYCFSEEGEVLLMERAQEPNLGLWSPCGGKLRTDLGESPYACACREAQEELGLHLSPSDLHLAGIVSEHGYQGQSHWLMFLFEVKPRLRDLPSPHREGRFEFFKPAALRQLDLPQTDRERIWPWFWAHRRGFFAAHCRCTVDGGYEWTLEESNPVADSAPARRRRHVSSSGKPGSP